jgi:hypothetical protein
MKTHLNGLAAALLLFTSCSTPNDGFTEYSGPSVVHGKGGTVRTTDGVEIWENGDPNRTYSILGVFEEKDRHSLNYGSIAEVTKRRGGDAAIIAGANQVLRGMDPDSRSLLVWCRQDKALPLKILRIR